MAHGVVTQHAGGDSVARCGRDGVRTLAVSYEVKKALDCARIGSAVSAFHSFELVDDIRGLARPAGRPDMDFAIVIRTMILEGNTLTMRAGDGVIAELPLVAPEAVPARTFPELWAEFLKSICLSA